jgi:hypothetical protein
MIYIIPFSTAAAIWIVIYVLAIPEARAIALFVAAAAAIAFVIAVRAGNKGPSRSEVKEATKRYVDRRAALITAAERDLRPALSGTPAQVEIDAVDKEETLTWQFQGAYGPHGPITRRRIPTASPIRICYLAEPAPETPAHQAAQRKPGALDEVWLKVTVRASEPMLGRNLAYGTREDHARIDILEVRRFACMLQEEKSFESWSRVKALRGPAPTPETPEEVIAEVLRYVSTDRIVGSNRTTNWAWVY